MLLSSTLEYFNNFLKRSVSVDLHPEHNAGARVLDQ